MWYPDSTAARLHQDKELRTLYACLGVSVALHALAMLWSPASRSADRLLESRELTAMLVSGSEPVRAAPVQRKPREQRKVELPISPARPVDPAPVAAAATPEPEPTPAVNPQQLGSASAPPRAPGPAAAELPPRPSPEEFDAGMLEAYRLALIDAARRYKRYPVQAVERGWEGRVEIRVVVGANGTIKSALVKRSSRYQILDDQALDMVRRAFNALDQVRPVPRGHEFTVDVPVVFELQTG